ncbi:hypothetical protein AC629_03735 [Bradyrhizobium sp. NAS80.1]|uniref:hypothetical protein n=1 Tax=Bradyrhizobium sp. NAS80.1 TaxID=1680159 RepID=UPI0009622AF6|nr:hypothetical protein [Bradyrhizobium sp. NAS80.1]OKO90980.1 hypothetical protein AC629_03735 [Bradyrhizobium sp. NAS80.1]
MGNRTAKFISALVGSVIAGAPLAAVSQNAPSASSPANAASDCLTSPKGIAPQGQHWRYRVERGTKRQCWYLRAEGGKDSAKAVHTAQAATDTPTADSAAPQQPSVQNARAEYRTPQSTGAPSTPTAPTRAAATTPAPTQQPANPTPDSDTQQPAVATRWPDASTTADQPASQPAPAPVAAAAQPSTKPSKSSAPVALAAADSTDNTTGSLQMLLLVVGGALTLAGLLASIIYRFAGGWGRAQAGDHRRVKWDNREPQDHDDSRAPWLNAEVASAPRAQRPGPVDFDAARPQPARLAAFTNAIGRIATQSASTHVEAAEPDEAEIAEFNGEFEIKASAPRLAANDVHDKQPVDRNEDVRADEHVDMDDIVDVDVITAMLERLAQEGPRLSQPSLEADLADPARSRRGQSAARA